MLSKFESQHGTHDRRLDNFWCAPILHALVAYQHFYIVSTHSTFGIIVRREYSHDMDCAWLEIARWAVIFRGLVYFPRFTALRFIVTLC